MTIEVKDYLLFCRIFGGHKMKDDGKDQYSLCKARCTDLLTNTCCKAPYKYAKQTVLYAKDELYCVIEADIQRQKQEAGPWLGNRNAK